MKKFRNGLLSSSLVAALMFTSFSAGAAEAANRPGFDKNKVGGKVVLTSFADAVKLTPLLASDSASNDIIGFLYDPLVKLDLKGSAVPGLATSWKYDKKNANLYF